MNRIILAGIAALALAAPATAQADTIGGYDVTVSVVTVDGTDSYGKAADVDSYGKADEIDRSSWG